ncbi:C-X-C motif chemokine 11 [Suncus etruscus]|uniref:C-X-C motif chemokine 11 n=1 Tax=Suncus etruscus TaxID=109475 RepID=UPI00211008FB|nr:C-X-C motif chemokine 11 [Suncus etruscus]
MKKGIAIFLAMVVCIITIQGFPMFKRRRCHCIDTRIKAVKKADVEKISIIDPTIDCDKTEIIITLKASKRQICLNPSSKQGKSIIKAGHE